MRVPRGWSPVHTASRHPARYTPAPMNRSNPYEFFTEKICDKLACGKRFLMIRNGSQFRLLSSFAVNELTRVNGVGSGPADQIHFEFDWPSPTTAFRSEAAG